MCFLTGKSESEENFLQVTAIMTCADCLLNLFLTFNYDRFVSLISSFTTVVVANDDTLWVIGVDEINQDVSLEFQPVYEAVAFPEETYTEEELDKLPKVIFNSSGCVIKKGYHAVSVISSCQEMVYDVTLQRGTARLFEVILEPKEKGKIKDYSAGFRHCLLLTSDN
jgi:hypothetical protein